MADQVINWLLLLRSGKATAQDYNDFLAWRAADPLHENAWQQDVYKRQCWRRPCWVLR